MSKPWADQHNQELGDMVQGSQHIKQIESDQVRPDSLDLDEILELLAAYYSGLRAVGKHPMTTAEAKAAIERYATAQRIDELKRLSKQVHSEHASHRSFCYPTAQVRERLAQLQKTVGEP